MASRLDYRIVNFVLACIGGALAIYVAVAFPAPHPPGSPTLVAVDRSSPSPMVVYVTGAVKTPGLYQISGNGRLYNALEAAGGLAPQAQSQGLNLARRLEDEEMVVVPEAAPRPTDTPQACPVAGPATGSLANTGTVEQLESQTDMSPTMAEALVQYRDQHGPFLFAQELKPVKGFSRRWRRLGETLGLPEEVDRDLAIPPPRHHGSSRRHGRRA